MVFNGCDNIIIAAVNEINGLSHHLFSNISGGILKNVIFEGYIVGGRSFIGES